MSVQAITWAFEQDVPSPGQKLVLIALANYATKTGLCFPGQEALAKDTSQGTRTVRRHLTALEQAGFIVRARRSRADGSRTSDEYQLNIQAANLAGSEKSQPAKNDRTTGQFGRAILEPSVKPSVSTPPVVPPMENSPAENQKEARHGSAPKPKNQKGTRLAADWEPTAEHFNLGSELGFDSQWTHVEAEKFRDYWAAESGQRASKRDWDAAFRNWLRKAAEYAGGGPGTSGRTHAGSNRQEPPSVAAALRQLQNRRSAV